MDYSTLAVEGQPITSAQLSSGTEGQQQSASTTLSATAGPSQSRLAPSWTGFTSVAAHAGPSKCTAKKAIPVAQTLKIVVANITQFDGDKPLFEKRDQVFVSITETSANQPSILAAVQEQLGNDFVIVSADGFEVKESSGTQGMCEL